MSFDSILTLGQTALELGLISSLTVLALFLSYSMLNVCDLSTDGCFTLGAVVGASVALSGHPFLAIPENRSSRSSFSGNPRRYGDRHGLRLRHGAFADENGH